jgi:hypothetical protein
MAFHQTYLQIKVQQESIEASFDNNLDISINKDMRNSVKVHNFTITGYVIEYPTNSNNTIYPVFEMSDVIKEVGLEGILNNMDVCEMASAYGLFTKHPEYS